MAQEINRTPRFTSASSANVAPQASPKVTETRGAVEALLAESWKGTWWTGGVCRVGGGGLSWLRSMVKFSFTNSHCLLLDKLPHVPHFFAVLIERLPVNVFRDKTFPLLPCVLFPLIMWTFKRAPPCHWDIVETNTIWILQGAVERQSVEMVRKCGLMCNLLAGSLIFTSYIFIWDSVVVWATHMFVLLVL